MTTTPVALVTGAGSGMGRATAIKLAAAGNHVALVGRRADPLEQTRQAIIAARGAATVLVSDITAPGAAQELITAVHKQLGRISLLVHAAGSSSRILNARWVSPEEWREVLEVNLTAVHLLTQAALEDLLTGDGGTVIAVSSLAAVNPNLLGGAAYGAAKAGVRNYMTFLHNTFRGDGLRAITVLPGEADTPILEGRARPPATEERRNMLQPDDVADAIAVIAALPQRAVVQELIIAPTRQRDTSTDLEISRHLGAPSPSKDHEDTTA